MSSKKVCGFVYFFWLFKEASGLFAAKAAPTGLAQSL
jgi:hypothetical protein